MIAPVDGPSCVVIIPHPDDESYAFAGALCGLRAESWPVEVICLTRGEAGVDRRGNNADLGRTRVSELQASCAALDVQLRVLDVPDGRVAEHPIDLSPFVRDASLVLTLGRDGVYGHPDHLACTQMVADAAFDGALWHAAFPQGLFLPLHRKLSRFMALGRSAQQLGVPPESVDHTLGVGRFRETKLRSIAAHHSQLRGGDPRSFLAEGLIDPLLDEEWFVHVRGPEGWPSSETRL